MSYGPGRHQWPQSCGMCPSGRRSSIVVTSRKVAPAVRVMFSPIRFRRA